MTTRSEEASVYLGTVRGPEHLDKLAEVAAWLDANKFSCTLSVSNEKAELDIASDTEGLGPWTQEKFKHYAMEVVIQALVRHMG